jgi:hypothetical protein
MLRALIAAKPRGRTVAVAVGLYGLAAVVMFAWPGFVGRVSDRCGGLAALDVRGFWNADEARALLQSCGPAGRTAYVQLELADQLFPAIAGAALVLATAALLHRIGPRAWPLLVPAIATTVLDYAENIAVWTLLARWPEVPAVVAAIGGPVSAAKQALGFLAHGVLLAALAVAAVGALRARRRSSPA